jgi:hypothetical protein
MAAMLFGSSVLIGGVLGCNSLLPHTTTQQYTKGSLHAMLLPSSLLPAGSKCAFLICNWFFLLMYTKEIFSKKEPA